MLTELQQAIADRLEKLRLEEGLEAIEIVVEAKGDLDSQVSARLQAASVGLVIATPGFQLGQDSRLDVDVALVVTENVIVNRSGSGPRFPAVAIAELLILLLHGWAPSEEWSPFQFATWELKVPDEDAQVLIYLASFKTSTVITETDIL